MKLLGRLHYARALKSEPIRPYDGRNCSKPVRKCTWAVLVKCNTLQPIKTSRQPESKMSATSGYGVRHHRIICRSYAEQPKNLDSREYRVRLIKSYAEMVVDWVKQGYDVYLLTFMFKRLSGRPSVQWDQMKQEISRIHEQLVTRVERHPKRHPDQIPRVLAFLDAPTNTWQNMELDDASINDGLHAHAFFGIPKQSRLREHLHHHFGRNPDVYKGTKLRTIDVERVTNSRAYVTDYIMKSIKKGRVEYDPLVLGFDADARPRDIG